MNTEILKIFLEEAASCLPKMREGIIIYESDASKLAELQESRRMAHTIKGSALMLKLSEIGEIAREIESGLKTIIQEKSLLTENQANDFLSKILILESHLNDLETGVAENKQSAETTAKESYNIPGKLEIPQETTIPVFTQSETEDFEIDAEMLEIFALEAEDLLQNISLNLAVLKKSPGNPEALLEIRRSSHTLKGSAGIIGLKKLSALAHRVEDLLDFLSENNIEGDTRIFEFLQTAFDSLSSLAAGENSSQLNEKIESVYQDCDEILAKLKTHKEASIVIAKSPQIEIKKEDKAEIKVDRNESENSDILLAEAANSNRSVIRVSLERLNDLFNLASEMVITRSVFEQRLSELEQQISELHHTTRRLNASTDKLEINFETTTPSAGNRISNSSNIFQSLSTGFDELEFDRYTEFHQTTRELIEVASDTSAINSSFDYLLENLNVLFDDQRRLIEDIQGSLLRLRMISLSSLAPRLQRTVQVTAKGEAKNVEFVIENEQLEIDAEILDAVVDPLLHLLRNAVAHGIETPDTRLMLGKLKKGKITLRAFSEGTHVVFSVSDDGRGISVADLKAKAVLSGFISKNEAESMSDEDAYSLIFMPGISTAGEINQISGRGVGMNIVKTSVSRRNGTIEVKSEPQRGTTFTIRIPVSLAVTRALLVKTGTQTYALPLNLIQQITVVPKAEFQNAVQNKILTLNESSYSFISFNDLIGFPQSSTSTDSATQILILKMLDTPCALVVDQVIKTEEIVVKPLGDLFKNVSQITGATVLGDGSVVPVLDLVYLLKNHSQKKSSAKTSSAESKIATQNSQPKVLSVLIVDDSPSVRQVNSNLIKNAGWQTIIAKDGLDALEILQSAGNMLPDIILTDVEMPRMDGYELLATLKKQSNLKKIPVIMITSRAGDKHRRKAFDLGADEYLAKPYEDAVLLDKIKILTKDKI